METQWAHIIPITSVPTRPSIRPLFLKALGTANIPDPKLPLNKCIRAPKSLKKFYSGNISRSYPRII